jgi:hypothetical protein
VFRIEQNGKMLLGRPKPATKGCSAPDEEEEKTNMNHIQSKYRQCWLPFRLEYFLFLVFCTGLKLCISR